MAMLTFLGALLPIFVLILLGAGLRRTRFLPEGFWQPAEKLTYFILLPALLVETLAAADLHAAMLGGPALALLLSQLATTALLVLMRPAIRIDGPGYSSVFQGGIRFNSFVGLAATAVLFGHDGLAAAAVAFAVLVPTGNIASIGAIVWYAGGEVGAWRTLRAILLNPLIVAIAIGALLNLSGIGLPFGSRAVFHMLGEGALPIGLLAVGGGLELAAIGSGRAPVLAAAAVKLAAMPLFTALACRALGVGGLGASVALLFQALPTAPTSYILARQMGGDHRLMAAIVTAETALAAVTLPLALALWHAAG